MKKEIHPEYREVLFHDTSVDQYFLIPSTLNTDQTKEWEDGKTYPYYPLDISSASHPFYTGKHKIVDTGGRVDRFKKRFAKSAPVVEEKLTEAPAEEVVEDAKAETAEAPAEEVVEDAKAETAEAPAEEVVEDAKAETTEEETPKEKE